MKTKYIILGHISEKNNTEELALNTTLEKLRKLNYNGDVMIAKIVHDSPDPIRLGGIGNKLAEDLEKIVKEKEVRCTVLGHIQRGGTTCTFDRILSTRYGVAAVELINEEKFGSMVCLKGNEITYDSLENVIGNNKKVDPHGELVTVAKKIGISFAD